MTTPITSICALCAINELLDIPERICCNAKTEQGHNVSCSTCFLDGNQHLCLLYFNRLMTLKHNSEAEFSERLEEFQVIVFYHLAILETTSPPVKTWALDMPAETFAGAPILVKFGKGIPCEISDDLDSEQDGSSHTNATSSDADPTIECATTEFGSPAQSNIDELEYFVLDHFNH